MALSSPISPRSRAEDGRLRKPQVSQLTYARISKPLSENFTLVIKHPVFFMGLLPHLLQRISLYLPLCGIRSRLSLPGTPWICRAILGGHPNAEAFVPELAAELDACPDRIDRQVLLLRWYFERLRLLPRERVIRYEDLVASPGETLGKIIPAAASLKTPLQAYDPATRYAGVPLDDLRAQLKNVSASFRPFYDEI